MPPCRLAKLAHSDNSVYVERGPQSMARRSNAAQKALQRETVQDEVVVVATTPGQVQRSGQLTDVSATSISACERQPAALKFQYTVVSTSVR